MEAIQTAIGKLTQMTHNEVDEFVKLKYGPYTYAVHLLAGGYEIRKFSSKPSDYLAARDYVVLGRGNSWEEALQSCERSESEVRTGVGCDGRIVIS